MNKLYIAALFFITIFSSCSSNEQDSLSETYNNTISFGQEEFGIQQVNVGYDLFGNISLLLHSLNKNQLIQLPSGSGAFIEFEGIKQSQIHMDSDYYVEIPEAHYYLGVVNGDQLLRSNGINIKKAVEGYVKIIELSNDNIKLRYLYKRFDGVMFKGEYSGPYTEK
ncbi:exported protein of unknown function [Tenacibaculum sp. 190130A14a]|uniref:DUF4251 domain-containing protein n=1 Tax=Tenacibaculum polynesiense TaxID=3137857 RepID=A0ABP1F4L4_9FLAO